MNERIKELIKDVKKEMFDINEVEIGEEIEDRDVLTEFMDGTTSETLEASLKEFSTEKSQDLLDYLTDKETFIEEEARWFIVENTTSILRSLAIAEKKKEVLKAIEDNQEHPYHKIKRQDVEKKKKKQHNVNVTQCIDTPKWEQ